MIWSFTSNHVFLDPCACIHGQRFPAADSRTVPPERPMISDLSLGQSLGTIRQFTDGLAFTGCVLRPASFGDVPLLLLLLPAQLNEWTQLGHIEPVILLQRASGQRVPCRLAPTTTILSCSRVITTTCACMVRLRQHSYIWRRYLAPHAACV